ncbi:MAG: hypothetical protein D6806_08535 [Deltaproteobacteria bacterium]|nr:MAG: hypothetical protein D6806_08535 [Deltaproteobacteria bacterium]
MENLPAEIAFEISIPIGPEWRSVELLRTSILNCLAAMFHDKEFCHSVSVVAGELMENSIKYGDWEGDNRHFRLRAYGSNHRIVIEVQNPIKPDSSHLKNLESTINWISSFDDPASAFMEKIKGMIHQDQAGDESGLGLARIASESNCSLEFESTTPGLILVRAVIPVAP